MRSLLVFTAVLILTASASAMTMPVRVKVALTGGSCRYTHVVLLSELRAAVSRECPASPFALPTRLDRRVTVAHRGSWVLRLTELP
jgi:hypothetical protein